MNCPGKLTEGILVMFYKVFERNLLPELHLVVSSEFWKSVPWCLMIFHIYSAKIDNENLTILVFKPYMTFSLTGGKLFAITRITYFLYFKRHSPYDAAKTLYMRPRGYNSWSDGAYHGDTLSPTKNQGHKIMGGALLEGGIYWVFYSNWKTTFPVRSFLLRHNSYALRRNSSLHCIPSSHWALSCLNTAWLLA